MKIVPIILAGGFGTRLWPISQKHKPKQFVNLIGDQTLFQQTVERLRNLQESDHPIVICNSEHSDLVSEQLQSVGVNKAQTILEPIGRGTAPAIAIAAFKLQSQDLDPLMLVLPADHVISDVPKFHEAIAIAKHHAEKNSLVCFGVTPARPETGYGYIEFGEQLDDLGTCKISRFVEKPNAELAKKYIDSGKYYWNSGMFMFRVSVYLQELKRNAPDIYQACEDIVKNSDLSSEPLEIDKEKFKNCRSDTIDYAIMEKTKSAVAVPLDIGWSDLGSWQSLWEFGKKDADGNVIIGDVDAKSTEDSYIHAINRKVVALGIKDCIIVETPDAVLVVSKDHCQDVKSVVDSL